MRKRLQKVLLTGSIVLAIGIGYALLISQLGFGIPCMLYLRTGYQCPSCGVSRMCLALMRFQFADAFHYNPAIFCLMPIGAVVVGAWAVTYVRTGETKLRRWMFILLLFMTIVLVLFGIARNLI